ncbi:MAG: hydrogenase iron-sulfur subunit [Candidatus Hydrothermarchaeota archaeon]|nr:hydrogenase iron-sulfur subunit [Candidatus Hydrothermarchaeota archaeon]
MHSGGSSTAKFEPKIIGFLCNWCSYVGADLAGVSRMQYPPNVRIIRVMCSGRVDSSFVLKAFAEGADGVMVTGCHPGQCHYVTGNYSTEKRIKMLQSLLVDIGIEKERLMLKWLSAAEGEIFANTVKEFTETVRKLGPSPLKIKKS